MNTDLRNRVVLPIVLPLAVLLGIAAFVGVLAFVLLFNPRTLSLTIAVVVAAGVMVAFSLANAVDREDMTLGRRSAILLVGVLPLLGGVGASIWSINTDQDLMWDIEPELSAPPGALAGAQNTESFCVFPDPEDRTTCEDVDELTFPAQPDADPYVYLFDNIQAGVPHNLQLFELAEEDGEPAAGALAFGVPDGAEVITGVDEALYQASPNQYEEGTQWYYNCVVHPQMKGVLTIGPPAEEEA